MNDQKPQRVALVTGGAVRVGRALSLGLAAAGFDLVVTYRTSAQAAQDLAARVGALGRGCDLLAADLTDPGSADAIASRIEALHGRLDLLVNSAASFDAGRLLDVDSARWDAAMALNVRAPHLLVRATADLLRRARGSVVNIADLSALQPWTEYAHHAVSKAALVHLTKVQARSLAPEVRVNAVVPGAVLPPDAWPEERVQGLAAATPLRRIGSPDDVVAAVLYLADAPFVTGQIIAVDGGRLLGS